MTGVMRKARAITAAAARDLSPHAQTKAVGGMATQAQQVAHELHPGEVAVAPGHLHDPADQEADEQRLDTAPAAKEVDPLGSVGRGKDQRPNREQQRDNHDRCRIWARHLPKSCHPLRRAANTGARSEKYRR